MIIETQCNLSRGASILALGEASQSNATDLIPMLSRASGMGTC